MLLQRETSASHGLTKLSTCCHCFALLHAEMTSPSKALRVSRKCCKAGKSQLHSSWKFSNHQYPPWKSFGWPVTTVDWDQLHGWGTKLHWYAPNWKTLPEAPTPDIPVAQDESTWVRWCLMMFGFEGDRWKIVSRWAQLTRQVWLCFFHAENLTLFHSESEPSLTNCLMQHCDLPPWSRHGLQSAGCLNMAPRCTLPGDGFGFSRPELQMVKQDEASNLSKQCCWANSLLIFDNVV